MNRVSCADVNRFELFDVLFVGQDSSVGLATCWKAWKSNSGWGRGSSHPYRPALEPAQPPIRWVLGLFPGGKAAGTWL